MKKVIFQMSVSIDGYFEGRNREIDWHIVDEDFNADAVETLRATDLLVMGRKTYELMASYWPTASADDPVTEHMNGRPKLVFSRTLERVDWQNFRLATG
jgi:dihydrofolate reductase